MWAFKIPLSYRCLDDGLKVAAVSQLQALPVCVEGRSQQGHGHWGVIFTRFAPNT